jgi:hypothetical protein
MTRRSTGTRWPRLAEHAELELGGLAEQLLEARRVLQARHLHEDAVGALLLDRGFGGAERVDAAADDLDRLADGAAHPVVDARIREGELDQSLRRLGDVEGAPARLAEDRVRDRLRQFLQLREDLGAVRRVGDAQLHAPPDDLDAAVRRDAGLAQGAPHIVAQLHALRAQEVVGVDLEQHVGAALEVEAEHDGPRRHDPGGDPGRQARLERLALLGREEARHREC